jgi:hypothetical protein
MLEQLDNPETVFNPEVRIPHPMRTRIISPYNKDGRDYAIDKI